jgi:hypothetical protein
MDIAIALLQRYSFDLGSYTLSDLQRLWSRFKPDWLRQATIEALFQGRYKVVSVYQILQLWERKGETQHRYNSEFERLVCDDVAVTYGERIAPKAAHVRKVAIAEISPNPLSQSLMESMPEFTENLTTDSGRSHWQVSSQYQKLQAISGTTTKRQSDRQPAQALQAHSNGNHSPAYAAAYMNMTLLSEGSLFVDKLRSMCSDRPVASIRESVGTVL